jgi:hypothetical protein
MDSIRFRKIAEDPPASDGPEIKSRKNLSEAACLTPRPWHAAVENIRGRTPGVLASGETGR